MRSTFADRLRVVCLTALACVAACGDDYGEGDATAISEPPPSAACPSDEHSCVTLAPAGWIGPVTRYEGNPANVPACPAAMPILKLEGVTRLAPRGAHTCSGCACGSVTGASCAAAMDQWASQNCGGLASSTPFVTNACVERDTNGSYVLTTRATTGPGSCTPSTATISAPSFAPETVVRVCASEALSRTGCDDGSICAPEPAPPFASTLCIMQAGDLSCPGAPYSQRFLTFAKTTDQRRCSPCACAPPSSLGCAGTYTTYDGAGCGGTPTVRTWPQGCRQHDWISSRFTSIVVTGSCTPGGGLPEGDVVLGDPVTICCVP